VQVLHKADHVFRKTLMAIGVATGALTPQMSSISGHFVLWEAVSQTKYCCSL